MAQKKTSKAVFVGLESGMQLFKWVVALLVILFWFSGITSVKPGNVGMLMRFGKLQGVGQGRIMKPGLALAAPYPIDEVIQVPEMKIEQLEITEIYKPLKDEIVVEDTIDPLLEGYAITGDMNVIQTKIMVKYKITDPIEYRLGVENPEAFLHDIVLTSFTQVAALWSIDDLLRQHQGGSSTDEESIAEIEKRRQEDIHQHEHELADDHGHGHDHGSHESENEVAGHSHDALDQQVYCLSKRRLDELNLGIEILSIEFLEIHPPRHVNQAFENVRNAKTQKEEQRHRAEKYAGQIVPAAEKIANAMIQDAKAYKEKLLAQTRANSNQFEPVFQEYKDNPEVVRQRVYLETLEQVFDGAGKLRFLPPDTKVVLPDEN